MKKSLTKREFSDSLNSENNHEFKITLISRLLEKYKPNNGLRIIEGGVNKNDSKEVA